MRRVYVDRATKEEVESLIASGLEPVELLTLPRDTPEDDRKYLLAKAQAMEEGFAECTFQACKILELEMKAAGMLSEKSRNLNLHVHTDAETLDKLLDWGHSRHALRANTPMEDVSCERLPADPNKP
jgi:hypothetical protein